MERKNKIIIPKGFFSINRLTITTSEALKDIIPAEWVDKNEKNVKKSIKLIKKSKG